MVADQRHGAAEAARDRSRRPWAVDHLAHTLEAKDLQLRVPEASLLLGELGGDGPKTRLAGRQDAVVPRTGKIDGLLEPSRGLGRAGHGHAEGGGKHQGPETGENNAWHH